MFFKVFFYVFIFTIVNKIPLINLKLIRNTEDNFITDFSIERRKDKLFSLILRDILFMTDKQQDLKKIHKRIGQIYLMVKQLAEHVGWQGIDNSHMSLDNDLTNLTSQQMDLLNQSSSDSFQPSTFNGREGFSSEHHQLLNNHKDILVDDNSLQTSFSGSYSSVSDNVNISSEEQVNRLTAQLTAAYYRIACLEEQLLAFRNDLAHRDDDFYRLQ